MKHENDNFGQRLFLKTSFLLHLMSSITQAAAPPVCTIRSDFFVIFKVSLKILIYSVQRLLDVHVWKRPHRPTRAPD